MPKYFLADFQIIEKHSFPEAFSFGQCCALADYLFAAGLIVAGCSNPLVFIAAIMEMMFIAFLSSAGNVMNPSSTGFDSWTSFFALSALAGGAAAVRLFTQKATYPAFRWLAILVLLFAISIAEWVLWWTDYITLLPVFAGFSKPYPFFFGVLLLACYRDAFPEARQALAASHRFVNAPLKWHLIPGVLFTLKCLPVLLWHWGIHLPRWGQYTMLSNGTDVLLYPMFAHMLLYPILIYRAYLPFLKKDPDLATWHKWIIRAFVAIGAAYIAHHLLSLMGGMSLRLDYLIAFFIVVFMGLTGWLGFVHPGILAGMSFLEAVLPLKYKKSALNAAAAAALATKVQVLFEQEKIYLDPDLTLAVLAKRLHVSRHHISQAINTVFETGFPEWLNQWRIEEAKTLLISRTTQQMMIKEVAYAAGFNSKAAFNAAFKKWTQYTPSAYRIRHTEGI